MNASAARLLACPVCHESLGFIGPDEGGEIVEGVLACTACRQTWPVSDGIPRLYDEGDVHLRDRVFRFVYDVIAPFHDFGVRVALPLLQGSSEEESRRGYIERLDLDALRPRADGEPTRILEVGVGSGANVPLVARALPSGLDAEIWGVDLSDGMLGQCRSRLRRPHGCPVHLALADAHALPFEAATFDRVFHVGGIATYGDPALALEEMARVARPGTPIVVVDEQLDPDDDSLLDWIVFRAFTAYDPDPRAPVGDVPASAECVRVEQVSRFYYCLSFQMPAADERHGGDDPMAFFKQLTQKQLEVLKEGYGDGSVMLAIMSDTMPGQYPQTKGYIEAIQTEFYGFAKSKTGPARAAETGISPIERERILIALLASRGARFNLAVHVYLGLMEGITVDDIARIMFLTAVYSGVDRFSDGVEVLATSIEAMATVAETGSASPPTVFGALKSKLPN